MKISSWSIILMFCLCIGLVHLIFYLFFVESNNLRDGMILIYTMMNSYYIYYSLFFFRRRQKFVQKQRITGLSSFLILSSAYSLIRYLNQEHKVSGLYSNSASVSEIDGKGFQHFYSGLESKINTDSRDGLFMIGYIYLSINLPQT